MFSKNSFRNTIRMLNSLDPDPARRFVNRLSQIITGYQQMTLVGEKLTPCIILIGSDAINAGQLFVHIKGSLV